MIKLNHIPVILICGNKEKIEKKLKDYKVFIKDQFYLSGTINHENFHVLDNHKIYYNNKFYTIPELLDLLINNEIDYLVLDINTLLYFNFTSLIYYGYPKYCNLIFTKIYTIIGFILKYNETVFHDSIIECRLNDFLQNTGIKSILDINGYYVNSIHFTVPKIDLKIDSIYDKEYLPIMQNKCSRIYKNIEQLGLNHYDAVLLTKDIETTEDFLNTMILFKNYSDKIIIFIRHDTELTEEILSNHFKIIKKKSTIIGNWFILDKNINYDNTQIYAISYDLFPNKLPNGYKILKCGNYTIETNMDYLSDNMGDNISHLNLYLNELTGIYWVWKNIKVPIVGFCHYRRFFTESENDDFSYDKILSKQKIIEYLKDYDMLIGKYTFTNTIQKEINYTMCNKQIIDTITTVLKKYILQLYPQYIFNFDKVMNSYWCYRCHLFITRNYILDAYCKWLYSFLIDATNEILELIDLKNKNFSNRRAIAYVIERMLTVWLSNQNLKLKEFTIMIDNNIRADR